MQQIGTGKAPNMDGWVSSGDQFSGERLVRFAHRDPFSCFRLPWIYDNDAMM